MSGQKMKLRNTIRYRFSLSMILFALILSFTASAIGYYSFQASFEKKYRERANLISRMIISQIDSQYIKDYLSTSEQIIPATIMKSNLKSLWDALDIEYIYISDANGTFVRYIYLRTDASIFPDVAKLNLGSATTIEDYYVHNDYPHSIGVSVPVIDDNGEVIGIVKTQILLKGMLGDIYQFIIQTIILNLLISLIITLIYLFYISSSLIKPLERISTSTRNFADSEYKSFSMGSSLGSYVEILTLNESISKMSTDIQNYIENIQSNVAEKEKMRAELSVAKQIQNSLLPKEYPRISEVDLFAVMDSAKDVGGDFYDFFYVGTNEYMVTLGDVSGKGIPAALFMASAKEIIRGHIKDGDSPSKTFENANHKLLESGNERMFITGWLGKINLFSGELTFVSAGHPPAMIRRKGKGFQPLVFNQNKILAAFEDTVYTQSTLQLNVGDVIFIYTDGVIEAEKDGEEFGEQRLVATLNKNLSRHYIMEDFIKAVRREISEFEGFSNQKDDITMLAFRYNGKTSDEINHIL